MSSDYDIMVVPYFIYIFLLAFFCDITQHIFLCVLANLRDFFPDGVSPSFFCDCCTDMGVGSPPLVAWPTRRSRSVFSSRGTSVAISVCHSYSKQWFPRNEKTQTSFEFQNSVGMCILPTLAYKPLPAPEFFFNFKFLLRFFLARRRYNWVQTDGPQELVSKKKQRRNPF